MVCNKFHEPSITTPHHYQSVSPCHKFSSLHQFLDSIAFYLLLFPTCFFKSYLRKRSFSFCPHSSWFHSAWYSSVPPPSNKLHLLAELYSIVYLHHDFFSQSQFVEALIVSRIWLLWISATIGRSVTPFSDLSFGVSLNYLCDVRGYPRSYIVKNK